MMCGVQFAVECRVSKLSGTRPAALQGQHCSNELAVSDPVFVDKIDTGCWGKGGLPARRGKPAGKLAGLIMQV